VWNAGTRRHDLAILTDNLSFDWFGLDGAIASDVVTLSDPDTAGIRRLVPHSVGDVLVQVRYQDPGSPETYEYLIARIQVHSAMQGWWFGHEGDHADMNGDPVVSVFLDPDLAHTQPTVLALVGDTPDLGTVVDVTGHGYVTLESQDTSRCLIDTTYSGRLRGVSTGDAQVTGTLALPFPDFVASAVLLVRVIDPHASPSNVLSLVRAEGDETDPRTKLNLLFLAEGFLEGDPTAEPAEGRRLFDEAVKTLTSELLTRKRHAPYNLLQKHINVWSHFEVSRQQAITIGCPITSTVWDIKHQTHILGDYKVYLPDLYSPPKDSLPDAYDSWELLRLVGFPVPDAVGLDPEYYRELWNTTGSLPLLMGYQDALATDEIIQQWKAYTQVGIPQARDTYYGLCQGARWGDRDSVSAPVAEMITEPPGGASDELRSAFARRVHEWFNPRSAVRTIRHDPRRYGPEYHSEGFQLLIRYFTRLENPSAVGGTPERQVGLLWDPETPIDEEASVRHHNSAGLVCILIDARREGGTSGKDNAFRIALGTELSLTPIVSGVDQDPTHRIVRFRIGPPAYEPEFGRLADSLAHELGHCYFNLGDEYESSRGHAQTWVEMRDNLTHLTTIAVPNPPADPAYPPPVDPNKVKWAALSRIAKADMVTRATVIGDPAGPDRSRRIIVTLEPGRATSWGSVTDSFVYLRRWKRVANEGRQLPFADADEYELDIEAVIDDHTLSLFGEASLDPVSFPAGSTLYVPRYDSNTGTGMTVVNDLVFTYMEESRWNPADPVFPAGVALTENHHDDPTKQSDRAQDSADVPPSITNFSGPCANHRVVGLYEGGAKVTRDVYRPAGACKMRSHKGKKSEGEFCFVCKYLMVNLVDGGLHADLDKLYPEKKKLWRWLGW
jgi:hypothetical protein